MASLLAASAVSPLAGVEAVPPERATVLPGGDSFGAMVGDVGGDGVRELIRLVPWGVNPSQMAVEVVSMAGDAPQRHGHHLVQRAASPDDTFIGNNPNEDPLLPVGIREPTRLIAWHGPDGERVMAAAIGVTELPRPCCLTLWWVTLDRAGETELALIQDTTSSAAHVIAVDLDDDGVDELAVAETPDPSSPDDTRVLVLRWNGTDFDRVEGRAEDALITGPLTPLGDSDGLPGEEFGFVAMPATSGRDVPSLHRFRLDGNRLVTEHAELPSDGSIHGLRDRSATRFALVSPQAAFTLRWRAGGREATMVARSSRGGRALGVLGRGPDARLLIVRGGAVEMLDADLGLRQDVASGAPAAWFVEGGWPPYAGELPGGDEAGEPAMIFGGRLISASEDSHPSALGDIAALPGKAPVGFFGPRRGWAAVADGGSLPVGRRGGSLGVAAETRGGSIAVMPAQAMMRPERDDGRLEPEITDAVLEGPPAQPVLLTAGGAVARFEAPPSSSVLVSGQAGDPAITTVGQDGIAQVLLVTPSDAPRDVSFTARLLVATPSGHGYGATWQVQVLEGPPLLTATAPLAPLSFSVPLSGRTAPTASLVVDGEPVTPGPDGTFVALVDAGPLPRTFRLKATDRVGNTAELTISVVGVVDYRRLPWVPIIAGLTLIAAGVLYLRVPRPSAVPATDPDEGVLEEVE